MSQVAHISICDMKIELIVFYFMCTAHLVFQQGECKDTSDYYTHAGFGLAILQLPFALPFYAAQSITRRTGIWIREGFKRVTQLGKRPVTSQASSHNLTTNITTKFSQINNDSERFD